jgi:hypothetical protein
VLATLFLVATLSCQTCTGCGLVNDKARLCAIHAEEERVALNDTRKQLASKVAAERIAALKTLGGLTRRHANAPSEKVARCIADALGDESSEVRELAVSLLGPPQHALVSMEALLDALSAVEKKLDHLLKEKRELQEKRSTPSLREKDEAKLEAEAMRNESARESCLAWRRILLGQLGLFPDDRVVAAVCAISAPTVAGPAKALKIEGTVECWLALHEARKKLPAAMDVNAPLVRLRNREAVRAVITNLTVLQAEIADLEHSRSSLSDVLPSVREMENAMLRALDEARSRTKEEMAAALAESPPGVPLPDPFVVPMLLDWLQQNLELFPEHLPGVVSPAW